MGIAKRPLRGAASRTTAGGPNPRSEHALCLLAMDDRRGYHKDEVLVCFWGPHPRIECATAMTLAVDQAAEVRVSGGQWRCWLTKC